MQFCTEPKMFIQGQQPFNTPTEPPPQRNDDQYGDLPFGMGVHFVINQRSRWERPLADRIVELVKFVPITPNGKADIALLDKEPRSSFSVLSNSDGNWR